MRCAAETARPSWGREPEGDLLELIRRVAQGDESAMTALYDATSRRVFGLALQILRDRETAEEATLDVFTQIWRQGDRYDREKGAPIAWILTLARTRAVDLLRTRFRHRAMEEPLENAFDIEEDGADPERSSAEAQWASRVRRALDRLPGEQRAAIEAAYYRGLSHTEVAESLGQPLGTVKTRIRAGLASLRLLLADTGEVWQ